jgi:hypothetical protein
MTNLKLMLKKCHYRLNSTREAENMTVEFSETIL